MMVYLWSQVCEPASDFGITSLWSLQIFQGIDRHCRWTDLMLKADLRSIKVVACWKRSVRRVVKLGRMIKVHGAKIPRAWQVKVEIETFRFRSITLALQCVRGLACEGGRVAPLYKQRIDGHPRSLHIEPGDHRKGCAYDLCTRSDVVSYTHTHTHTHVSHYIMRPRMT